MSFALYPNPKYQVVAWLVVLTMIVHMLSGCSENPQYRQDPELDRIKKERIASMFKHSENECVNPLKIEAFLEVSPQHFDRVNLTTLKVLEDAKLVVCVDRRLGDFNSYPRYGRVESLLHVRENNSPVLVVRSYEPEVVFTSLYRVRDMLRPEKPNLEPSTIYSIDYHTGGQGSSYVDSRKIDVSKVPSPLKELLTPPVR